jgi:hypothetical protein
VVAAITGAIIFDIGCTLLFFAPGPWRHWLITTALTIGYLVYIPAEFLVLYSRLHILSADKKTLRFILVLITAECLLVTLPNAVISAGSFASTLPGFIRANHFAQRIEIIIYMVTEMVISFTYIRQTLLIWGEGKNPKAKKVLTYLVCANAFLIGVDTVTVVVEFTGHPEIMAALLVRALYILHQRVRTPLTLIY